MLPHCAGQVRTGASPDRCRNRCCPDRCLASVERRQLGAQSLGHSSMSRTCWKWADLAYIRMSSFLVSLWEAEPVLLRRRDCPNRSIAREWAGGRDWTRSRNAWEARASGIPSRSSRPAASRSANSRAARSSAKGRNLRERLSAAKPRASSPKTLGRLFRVQAPTCSYPRSRSPDRCHPNVQS